MAKVKISEFNSNPALNTDIDSINIAEGCSPSGINDAIRELMAQLKDWQSGTSNDPYVVGSSGSLTLNQGTANTVPYLNGSKVVTSGTALSFDGSNLGLGVTPSAFYSGNGSRALEFTYGAIYSFANTPEFDVGTNFYLNSGGSWIYKANGYATRYSQQSGQHQWHIGSSGTAGNAITFTQAMTLTSGGNLLVGTTTNYGQKIIASAANGTAYSSTAQLRISGGSTNNNRAQIVFSDDNLQDGKISYYPAATAAASYFSFSARSTESDMILDGSGNLLVGTTSAGGNGGFTVRPTYSAGASQVTFNRTDAGATNSAVMLFQNGGSQVGYIQYNNTTTSYGTSSDYRLKNVTGALTGYKERLMSLQPKQGTWKVDGSEFRGFLAHDFAVSYRASVTGEKDAVDEAGNPIYQGMQASSSEVMADLVAMVNELITENSSLKARLDAANL